MREKALFSKICAFAFVPLLVTANPGLCPKDCTAHASQRGPELSQQPIIDEAATPAPTPAEGVPAFPGAEGYGSSTVGGRGGTVIEVTNLNDSGPGSLRAALEASGSRIVVFRTGGTIKLASDIVVLNPFLTVAGQTAPGDGITIRGGSYFLRYSRRHPAGFAGTGGG